MEEQKQNIFKQFVLSVYSFKDYRNFIHTHGGKVFLYILILTCLTYVLTFIIPTREVLPYIYQIDSDLVDEYVPYFEITNGEFYIEEEVYYEDEDGLMVLYATSDYTIPTDTAYEILGAYSQGFIISADEMVIKQATGAISNYAFTMMPDMTRDTLYGMIPAIKIVVVFVYILAFVGYIGVYLFGSLVCALIGQIINLIIKAPVTFGSIFKITAYARTVPILIKMILSFTAFNLHWVLFYALFILYMVWALIAIKKNDEQPALVDGTNEN